MPTQTVEVSLNVSFLPTLLVIAGCTAALLLLHAASIVKRDNWAVLDVYEEMLETSRNSAKSDSSDDPDAEEDGEDLNLVPQMDELADAVAEMATSSD